MSDAVVEDAVMDEGSMDRMPMVGDSVWYVFEDRDGLEALPATLYKKERDGTWGLNYQREGVLVYIDHVAYCGIYWKTCHWCWPGESPPIPAQPED